MKQLMLRLTNNIRMLEHAACLAEGPVIGLQDDFKAAAKKFDAKNILEDDVDAIRATVELLQEQTAALHLRMTELAGGADLEIPDENVVNGPGGK